jgi:hypothetical protein
MRYRHTPGYSELELPLTDGEFGVCYVMPRDEHSIWVCCCLVDTFTPLVESFLSVNELIQAALLRSYRETWPQVMELLDNGMNHRYSPAALIVLEDPDDATGRWFVASVVGNLPSLSLEDVFDSRTKDAVQRVFAISDAAIRQYRTWEVDKVRLGAKVFSDSVSSDLKASAGFVRDNFGTIVGLLNG